MKISYTALSIVSIVSLLYASTYIPDWLIKPCLMGLTMLYLLLLVSVSGIKDGLGLALKVLQKTIVTLEKKVEKISADIKRHIGG
jgi:hypothetical protein